MDINDIKKKFNIPSKEKNTEEIRNPNYVYCERCNKPLILSYYGTSYCIKCSIIYERVDGVYVKTKYHMYEFISEKEYLRIKNPNWDKENDIKTQSIKLVAQEEKKQEEIAEHVIAKEDDNLDDIEIPF